MKIPDYWLNRPPSKLDDQTREAFHALWEAQVAPGGSREVEYTLTAPRWQFLCYLTDHLGVAVHGSAATDIAVFEPRQSKDENPFGNQKAVYAAADGLWAMFYAILDRKRFPMSLNNACVRLSDRSGQMSDSMYVFSISKAALVQQPWARGMVYILPMDTFVRQPALPFGEMEVHVPQLASLEPVTPLARLAVGPEDFPFLHTIRGHDDARWQEYVTALNTAGPWPDD